MSRICSKSSGNSQDMHIKKLNIMRYFIKSQETFCVPRYKGKNITGLDGSAKASKRSVISLSRL